jgi:hypothetical protein
MQEKSIRSAGSSSSSVTSCRLLQDRRSCADGWGGESWASRGPGWACSRGSQRGLDGIHHGRARTGLMPAPCAPPGRLAASSRHGTVSVSSATCHRVPLPQPRLALSLSYLPPPPVSATRESSHPGLTLQWREREASSWLGRSSSTTTTARDGPTPALCAPPSLCCNMPIPSLCSSSSWLPSPSAALPPLDLILISPNLPLSVLEESRSLPPIPPATSSRGSSTMMSPRPRRESSNGSR